MATKTTDAALAELIEHDKDLAKLEGDLDYHEETAKSLRKQIHSKLVQLRGRIRRQDPKQMMLYDEDGNPVQPGEQSEAA